MFAPLVARAKGKKDSGLKGQPIRQCVPIVERRSGSDWQGRTPQRNLADPAMSFPRTVQPKLVVGPVDDPLEQEADSVADRIMRMPSLDIPIAAGRPRISRACAGCAQDEKLQHKTTGLRHAADEAPDIVHEVLRKPGRPLDTASLAYFEPRFGHDFSQVRVHSGVEAEQSAQALYAHAYTVGRDIVFGANRFAPATQDGRWLIAHELTHMVQQNSGQLQAFVQRDPLPPKTVKSDFEEKVLSELHDLEGNPRIQIPAARKQRLFELFSSLHRAEADAIYERLRVRRPGDVLSERFHDILATNIRKDLLQSLGLKGILARQIVADPADFCRPFSPREINQGLDFEIANAMDHFVNGDLRDFFGDEAADLYDTYLTSAKKNVTPQIFEDPKSELVQSFVSHDATEKRQRELAAIIEKNLPNNCGKPLSANKWISPHGSAIISRKELEAGFSFGGIVPTIPGIVAGGISSGGGSIRLTHCFVETNASSAHRSRRTDYWCTVEGAVPLCGEGRSRLLPWQHRLDFRATDYHSAEPSGSKRNGFLGPVRGTLRWASP